MLRRKQMARRRLEKLETIQQYLAGRVKLLAERDCAILKLIELRKKKLRCGDCQQHNPITNHCRYLDKITHTDNYCIALTEIKKKERRY